MMEVLAKMGRLGEKKDKNILSDLTPEEKAKIRASTATESSGSKM